jgi:hypothetical protein
MSVPQPSHRLVLIAQGRHCKRRNSRQSQGTIRFLCREWLVPEATVGKSTAWNHQSVNFFLTQHISQVSNG